MEKKLTWVDNARILACLAVIVLHISTPIVSDVTDHLGMQWRTAMISSLVVRWCVPVFVMLSGALLLTRSGAAQDPVAFYKKRLGRIAIPTLAWTCIYLIAKWYIITAVREQPFPVSGILADLLAGRPYPHLWYLYMLVGLYLICAYLQTFIRDLDRKSLTWLVATVLFFTILDVIYGRLVAHNDLPAYSESVRYVGYLLIGYLIARHSRKHSKAVLLLVFVLSALLTVLGYFYLDQIAGRQKALYLADYNGITVMLMATSALLLIKQFDKPLLLSQKLTQSVAQQTLGIYLIHPLVQLFLTFIGLDPLSYPAYGYIPLSSLIIFTISFGLVWGMRKTSIGRLVVG